MLNIYSLVDYCYVLTVGGLVKGLYLPRMYTIDDMENPLYVVKDEECLECQIYFF
jgi:hypothetical protein